MNTPRLLIVPCDALLARAGVLVDGDSLDQLTAGWLARASLEQFCRDLCAGLGANSTGWHFSHSLGVLRRAGVLERSAVSRAGHLSKRCNKLAHNSRSIDADPRLLVDDVAEFIGNHHQHDDGWKGGAA